MKFKDFKLKSDNHFVAMQYYGLILNRTFLVVLTNDLVIGIKVNGLVSIESGGGFITKELSKNMAIGGDLQNPYSYMKSTYINRLQDCELLDASILAMDKSNFVIQKAAIKNVWYDPRKKWGMSYYPHDGKVYVETVDGKKKRVYNIG